MCVRATELAGAPIATGDTVTVLLGSACRDGARFPAPDALRLDRHPNPHLAFGRGPHACLGQPLHLAQPRATLPHLSRHQAGLRLAGTPHREPNPVLRGLISLPLSTAA